VRNGGCHGLGVVLLEPLVLAVDYVVDILNDHEIRCLSFIGYFSNNDLHVHYLLKNCPRLHGGLVDGARGLRFRFLELLFNFEGYFKLEEHRVLFLVDLLVDYFLQRHQLILIDFTRAVGPRLDLSEALLLQEFTHLDLDAFRVQEVR